MGIGKRKIKVYFLGSGEFAVPYLDILTNCSNVELVGVGTQPDRPFGRRRQLRPTPVGIYCGSHFINCERIESVSSDEFYARMLGLQPDLIVVVSFGQILRERILEFPRLGCLNVHSSLLPKYRGASPITSMILGGEAVGGVTFMRMDIGLDTGPVYDVFRVPLADTFTTQSLEKYLSEDLKLFLLKPTVRLSKRFLSMLMFHQCQEYRHLLTCPHHIRNHKVQYHKFRRISPPQRLPSRIPYAR